MSFCFFSPAFSAQENKVIKYDLAYENNLKTPFFKIALSFDSDANQSGIIKLPSCSSCATKLYTDIKDLQVTGGSIEKTSDPSEYLLIHSPHSHIILTYKIKQGWKGKPTNFVQSRSPLLQRDYFRFKGEHLLIYPKALKKDRVRMELDWHIPSNWTVSNSFGSDQVNQTIDSSLEDILSSLFLGGNFQLYKTKVKGGYIWTAIQDQEKWYFSHKKFNTLMIKIISTQRQFWDDYSFSNFLVSLIPVGTTCNAMSGAGLKNSFTLNLATECTLDNKHIIHLISHENFHIWNGAIPVFKDQENNEPYDVWFLEGFTEYYSKLFNLRDDLITFEDYIKDYNTVLINYYASPYKSLTIKKLAEKFWKDIDAQLLPYKQGEIIAHNWNLKIKQYTKNQKSLDDLIRIFINPKNPEGYNLTLHKMSKLAEPFLGDNLLKKNIEDLYQGIILIPDKDALGSCVNLTNKMLAPYEQGFDISASKKAGVIKLVNPKSNAYAAGLRDGQKLISAEYYPDDISKKSMIKVNDDQGKIRTIRYWPYKGELQLIPQYLLNSEMWKKNPKKCLDFAN